jgi:hypothetical protein
MTRLERSAHGCEVWFWSDGGMQNGFFIRDNKTGDETGLYCDLEGGEYIEHILQLGAGDFYSECTDELQAWRTRKV